MALLRSDPVGVADRVRSATTPASRARVLAVVALGPPLAGYLLAAAVFALVTALAPDAEFTTGGVLLAALPGWLALQQVPLGLEGHQLGALPLLPTLLVSALVARVAAAAVPRLDARGPRGAGRIVATVALTHACLGLVVALVCGRGPVAVDLLAACYHPALVSAVAATLGVLRRAGLLALLAEHVDDLAVRGLRAGALAVAALLGAGAGVLTLGLVLSTGALRDMFAQAGTGAGAGMLLLSLGYLPNAVVAGAAFATGPGFALGQVSVALLEFTGGPAPALPLLAALPAGRPPWWPVFAALPLAVGLLVGWVLRRCHPSRLGRLRAVAVAAIVVAMSFAVLAGVAGGSLGGGPFHPLDLRAAAVSLVLVVWIGVPGALVAWLAGPRPEPPPAPVPPPPPPPSSEEPEEPEGTDEPEETEDTPDEEAAEEPPEAAAEPAEPGTDGETGGGDAGTDESEADTGR